MRKINKKLTYEIIMSILALIAVVIAIMDLANKINLDTSPRLQFIDNAILVIFVIDYFTRLFIAKDKKEFIKKNIPDLIAIIPFNAMFKVFRIAKLLRFTRLTKISKVAKISKMSKLSRMSKVTKATKLTRIIGIIGKFNNHAHDFLHTNGLIYVLSFTLFIIFAGAFGLYLSEKISFPDALWWSFVTATTVGYGDISPATLSGRIIAAVLMLIGIGTIGMITGSIATFFIAPKKEKSECDSLAAKIINESDDLNDDEKAELINYLNFILSKRRE